MKQLMKISICSLRAVIFMRKCEEESWMKDVASMMQFIFAALGGAIGAVMGGFDGFLYALIVFVGVDYVTGVMAGILSKELSSRIGFRGIFKKIVIFCLVAVSHIIDSQVIGNGSVLRTAVIFFYLSNEGISILENAAHIGLPIPKKLKMVLEQIKEDDGNEGE
jgi:toxin secretion/phage lysis holin